MNAIPNSYDAFKLASPPSADYDYERKRAEAIDRLAERDRHMSLADWLADDPFAYGTLCDVLQQANDEERGRDPRRAAGRMREQFALWLGARIDRELREMEMERVG